MRPAPDLSDDEKAQVKRVAEELLDVLKRGKIVLDWRKEQSHPGGGTRGRRGDPGPAAGEVHAPDLRPEVRRRVPARLRLATGTTGTRCTTGRHNDSLPSCLALSDSSNDHGPAWLRPFGPWQAAKLTPSGITGTASRRFILSRQKCWATAVHMGFLRFLWYLIQGSQITTRELGGGLWPGDEAGQVCQDVPCFRLAHVQDAHDGSKTR